MAKSDPYFNTKEHKEWRAQLIKRDGGCVVCGNVERINAHHLIPRKIEKFRSILINGVCLCPSHHCMHGFKLSPHSHGSMLFYLWMRKNRPEQLKWCEDNWEGGL
jgi:hypothetical protein